jgi:hypothetical protein
LVVAEVALAEVALAEVALARAAVVILVAVAPRETGDVDTFKPRF